MLFKMHWCCFLLLIIPMLFCYNRFALSNATGWHLANNLNAKHIQTHIYYHIIMVGCVCVRLWGCEFVRFTVVRFLRLWGCDILSNSEVCYVRTHWCIDDSWSLYWLFILLFCRWGKIASALGSTMNNRFHLQQMILIVMYFLPYFVLSSLYISYNRFFLNFFINQFFQV